MRLIYSIAWWIALPLVLLRLWLRGRKEPGYRAHWGERLGFYSTIPPSASRQGTIWLHAVSVGETRAAEPLVHALLDTYPDHAVLLTHMTSTGRATGAALFAHLGERVRQSYLPYDTGWMTSRFIRYFRPGVCVLMETEVWPNLIAQCGRHGVPVAMVNARLSERSLRKAQRFAGLMSEAASGLASVGAQTEADAARIRAMGAKQVSVTGSVKFDITPPESAVSTGLALRKAIGARPVLLCASTREGEEHLVLDAFAAAVSARTGSADDNKLSVLRQALLIIVPRHPQRFDEVERMIRAKDLSMCRRSAFAELVRDGDQVADATGAARLGRPASVPFEVQVMLGDTMGEMFAYYAACDVAFIGGSLLPLGGQNLIEACAVGKPVLVGPHTFNFQAATEDAVTAGAAWRVEDAPALLRAATTLLTDDAHRASMAERAHAFAVQHRGATVRTMALLRPLITDAEA